MRKSLAAIAAVLLTLLTLSSAAGAQETQIGSITADPATVPEAGEYTFSLSGTGFIPDTEIVVGPCTAPGDPMVAGVTSTEEVSERLTETLTGFTDNCNLTALMPASVDSSGNFTAEVTATVGDNFVIGAGALDLSQGGGIWVPIVDPAAAAQLAVTGAEHWALAGIAAGLLLLGAAALFGSRRLALR